MAHDGLPTHDQLKEALSIAVKSDNGGLGFNMWATLLDRTGAVVAIVFSGEAITDQWLGSRLISAEKANAANALSLDNFALSTANLYAAVQPGGTLYGLAATNPVDVSTAYGGDPTNYGTPRDHLIGKRIGGVVIFGGGLALYAADGSCVGALGVSGDYSGADHNIAWKMRHALELDYVPAGVDGASAGKASDDNIIYDLDPQSGKSASGWGHPVCPGSTKEIGERLPITHPVRPSARAAAV